MNECCFFIKRNNFISVSGEIFTTVYMRQPDMKLTAGVISLRSFSQKSNFILGDKKYHLNTTRNESYEREHLRIRLFHQNKNDVLYWTSAFLRPAVKRNFILFRPQWKAVWTELPLWWIEIWFQVDFISGLMLRSHLHLKLLMICFFWDYLQRFQIIALIPPTVWEIIIW